MNRYPVIQAKLNTQSGYRVINPYVMDFTLDRQIEDTPYAFIEDELRLRFFDWDDGFLSREWSKDITKITVKISYLDYSATFQTDLIPSPVKAESLEIDETFHGTLILSTGITDGAYTIVNWTGGESGWGSLYSMIGWMFALLTGESNRLSLLQDVDLSSLPIWYNGKCYLFVMHEFWGDHPEITVGQVLNEIALLFDAFIIYEKDPRSLVFQLRENPSTIHQWNGTPIYRSQYEPPDRFYDGIRLSFTKSGIPHRLAAQFMTYDIYGNFLKSESRKGDQVEILIGGEGQNMLERELRLLPYLKVDPDWVTPPPFIEDAKYPQGYLESYLIDRLAKAISRYVRPGSVSAKYTVGATIPELGAYYTFPNQFTGYLESMNYAYKNATGRLRARKAV